jgi:hypothetical protein
MPEVTVSIHPVIRYRERILDRPYYFPETRQLCIRRTLVLKVAQQHHAQVARVVLGHMGAHVRQGTTLPGAAAAIDNQVISNITKPALKMAALDLLNLPRDIRRG